MIKFKEHDGMLFKMLEEPVPLKENDENVLVRFITHGVIGEYVIEHWLDCNQKNVPIYVEGVDSDGDVTVWIENGNEHHCCPFPMFEIIGTPVAEGSEDWAWYQMMQGNRVTKAHLKHTYWYYDARPHLQCISEDICGTLQMVSPEIWIKTADKDGWQIYKEPKEEKESPIDHVEMPLRKLILQAMREGKNIRTFYQDMVFTPVALTGLLANGKFRWWDICNWELTTREQNYFPSISTSSDRQIYTEPESLYKVGDWVEIRNRCDGNTYQRQIDHIGCEIHIGYNRYDFSGESTIETLRHLSIIRKLKPSEVIVNIGCLSGTVERHYENPKYWFKLRSSEYNYALISIEMLDAQTRELVEGLLKDMQKQMDKHYDRHNEGICAVCGCTVSPWEYRCRSCRNKVAEDVAKEKEQKPEVKE